VFNPLITCNDGAPHTASNVGLRTRTAKNERTGWRPRAACSRSGCAPDRWRWGRTHFQLRGGTTPPSVRATPRRATLLG
jgi:hypothetical protein